MSTRKRVPLIRQITPTDCALACLSMIISYYKGYVSFHELKERLGSGRDGVSLWNLNKTASSLNFKTEVHKDHQITKVTSPIIVFWESMHYVVLEKISKRGYHILDPDRGRLVINKNEFYSSYAGYYLELLPTEKFEYKKQPNVWIPYLKLAFEKPRLLFTILACSLLIQLTILIMPMITKFAIDDVLPDNTQFLPVFFLAIASLIIFKGVVTYLRGRFLAFLRMHLDWRLMSRFFKHLINLPFQYFQTRSFGEIIYRANSHVMIRELLSQQTVMACLDISLVFIILIYLALNSWWLTIWVVFFGIINIILLSVTQNKLKLKAEEELSEQSKFQNLQVETLYGIFGIKMAGVENIVFNQWKGMFNNVIRAFKKNELYSNTINSYIVSLEIAAPLVILGLSLSQVLNGNLSPGSMIAFYSLTGTFFGIVSSIVDTGKNMFTLDTYLQRMSDVLDAPIEKESKDGIKLDKLSGNIALENVSFSYTKFSPQVLKNVSVSINSGQKVAVVGPSGSGKSTLARMLLGLYEPTSGCIYFDGIRLNDLDKKWLRRNIGMVPQDATLFNKSILHNISVYEDDPLMENIYNAAKMAQIHDEIMKMPLGYHTPVSEMSMNISGGQKQRIMMARALLQNPSILLLDEATSSLDSINESEIDQHLNNLNCTRIVIAHRISTIKNADLILVLKDGVLIEKGTHEELLSLNGLYNELYSLNQEGSLVDS